MDTREQRREAYLAGRQEIDGRRLRFEAGWDICTLAVGILREYAADCESEFFCCVHDEDLEQVRALIAGFERIEADALNINELEALKGWLHEVADLLPRLWD